mmetsp:Transcript_53203/g.72659  ORF Transcript_53203/g.72659 Transcript_53203/m.72659 type:complete len:210 (+) Transcript_53203:400-1029(+)
MLGRLSSDLATLVARFDRTRLESLKAMLTKRATHSFTLSILVSASCFLRWMAEFFFWAMRRSVFSCARSAFCSSSVFPLASASISASKPDLMTSASRTAIATLSFVRGISFSFLFKVSISSIRLCSLNSFTYSVRLALTGMLCDDPTGIAATIAATITAFSSCFFLLRFSWARIPLPFPDIETPTLIRRLCMLFTVTFFFASAMIFCGS